MKKLVSRSAVCALALLVSVQVGTAVSAPVPFLMHHATDDGCGTTKGIVCSTLQVPIDRSRHVPGTIGLRVQVLPTDESVQRGVVFLVAGGPGQGSAEAFGLGDPLEAGFYRDMFPGYTLVAYDDRGTGRSGPLSCPPGGAGEDMQALTADCAAAIGPAAGFYGTADHAEDLEAVRQALGFDRIAIWGVSYGTKLALAYAAAHPQHVERLVLDSVVQPDVVDPFDTGLLRAMPRTLGAYCPRATCRSDFAADVAAVANGLVQTPLSGSVRGSNHTITPVHVGAVDFLGLVVAADLDPGLAAELPAAVHAARTGYPQPLLRIYNLEEQSSDTGPTQISDALYLATVCRDGPFPWLPDTPIGDRPALAQAALAALPAGAFGPFAPWAAEIGNVDLCLGWPAPAGGTGIEASALPDVPVLAVSGGLDLRTPTANAAAVVARFPQGHLLVVPGVGHSVLSTDPSGCSQIAVRHWILTNAAPSPCRSARPYLQPVPTLAARAAKRLTPAQSLSLAANTLHEAEAVWLLAANASIGPVSGVVSGRLATNELGFNLSKYSDTAGLALSGRLTLTSIGAPVVFKGTVTVSGTAAKHGRLTVTSSGVHWRPGK